MFERCCLPAAAAGLSVLLSAGTEPAVAGDEPGDRPGWSLRLGGFYNALVIVREQTNPPGEEIRNYDFNQRGRSSFQAQNRLDNALTLGFQAQYEMQQSMAINRSYLFLRSGIGLFQFGTMYTAAYQLHEEPLAAGWYTDDSGHYQGFASTNGLKTNVQTMPGFISDRDMTATWISRTSRFFAGRFKFPL